MFVDHFFHLSKEKKHLLTEGGGQVEANIQGEASSSPGVPLSLFQHRSSELRCRE